VNKNRIDIPSKSGVYLFKSQKNVILYIGKAKNLKKRIGQYFQKKTDPIIENLLNQTEDIDFIITDDEKDALHLEYNLIHTYKPPFNIRLKDDKSFPFIEISTSEKFPGIYYSRNLNPNYLYIGPITNAKKTRILIDLITRVFKIRTCNNNMFKKKTACLFYYIDRCSAPCIKKIDIRNYQNNVSDAIDFLKGKRTKVAKNLTRKMNQHARELQFEKAQKLKEEIELIRGFVLESYISSPQRIDYDTVALYSEDSSTFIIHFSVIAGIVKKKNYFSFTAILTTKENILRNFLISFYKNHNIPQEITVPFYPTDHSQLEDLFAQFNNRSVRIKIPQKGNKKKMLDLAMRNLNSYKKRNEFHNLAKKLKSTLKLKNIPCMIEGYDISHFGERERVGAVVVFNNGKADKSLYRNYIIKKADAGDIDALKEVLERRLKKIEQYPDLIVIDGGKAQLNLARKIKSELNINSDIIAIAKKEERIFFKNGNSIIFPEDSPERFLFQNIRDEAHRRAISLHRKKREKIK